jgi:DNA (cytosine-5)-methyltransferase 1
VIKELPILRHGGTDKERPPARCVAPLRAELRAHPALEAWEARWRDWPKHLVAECHKKKTGKTYPGVYGRMKYDEPAPTLTTQFYGFGNGRFGHPTQARAISLREGALLQGFPPSYSFIPDDEPVQFKPLGRMIGNAVPVDLGRVIGESIIKHVRQYGESFADRHVQHVDRAPSSAHQGGRNGKGSAVHV